jgi:hypothetical protein
VISRPFWERALFRLALGGLPGAQAQGTEPLTVSLVLAEPTKRDECAVWLLALLRLRSRPLPPKDVVALAAEWGVSRSTVYRARRLLAGRVKTVKGKGWVVV